MQPARSLIAWPSLHKPFLPLAVRVPPTPLGCPPLTAPCSLLGMQQVRELRTLHEERQRDTRLRLLAWQEEVRLRLRAELEARQQEWQTELEARSRKEAADLTCRLQVGGVPQGACQRRLVLCSDRTTAALRYRGGQCWGLHRREVVGRLLACRGSLAVTRQLVGAFKAPLATSYVAAVPLLKLRLLKFKSGWPVRIRWSCSQYGDICSTVQDSKREHQHAMADVERLRRMLAVSQQHNKEVEGELHSARCIP